MLVCLCILKIKNHPISIPTTITNNKKQVKAASITSDFGDSCPSNKGGVNLLNESTLEELT